MTLDITDRSKESNGYYNRTEKYRIDTKREWDFLENWMEKRVFTRSNKCNRRMRMVMVQ